MNENIWQLLGIEKTTDQAAIRQAYRAQLPSYHPETDPDGFKALREAYESAIKYAQSPETMADEPKSESEQQQEVSVSLTEKQLKANEICEAYQTLLDDPRRCFNVNEWQKFIGSFYDYSMAVIDSVKWRLLEISYESKNISESCVKLLADSLRWRQLLMIQFTDDFEKYDNYLNHIDRGDLFNYTYLPTTSKTLQNVTIDYMYYTRWLFWERRSEDIYAFLSQDTVIYLPDDKNLMLKFSYWHCIANIKNQAILDYALKCISQNDQDENIIIEWKYIAAIQYTLLDNKQESLQSWLDLYSSGHYQDKAASWIAGWCEYYNKDYFPLLIMALNNSYCIDIDNTENYLNAIPQLTATTVSRLAELEASDYSPEIANFIDWALNVNWNYRQVLSMLLLDDGTNRLYRLYRHAIMLRHGNERLLQEILDERSDDPFEQFILQNLQRQAGQNLTWLSELPPVQEFKAWLYDSDENAPIPAKFDPNSEDNHCLYCRLWLDRLDYLPYVAMFHLYNNLEYSYMEMYDWVAFLTIRIPYKLPAPPDASICSSNKNAYWQWYRNCLLVISIASQPFATAKYLQTENNTFQLPDDNLLSPLINIFKQGNWQNETELYNLINNDSKLIDCILINYPNSIESYIDDTPDSIDFKEIEQKLEQVWQTKLAKQNPLYLMILYTIVFNKPDQKTKLNKMLQDITGDNKELIKVSTVLQKNWESLSSDDKIKYNYTELVDEIVTIAKRLSNSYGICDEDDLTMLDEFKNTSDNDLVLRLCAASLIAKNAENQKKLNSQALPKNKWWQFWRWNGRTNLKGLITQLLCNFVLLGLMSILSNYFELNSPIFSKIGCFIIAANTIFAIKRRLNDSYKGQPLFFYYFYYSLISILVIPWTFWPFRLPGIKQTNRFGPPVEEITKEKEK
ncbi:hypothetical protein GYW75_09265 [Gilliamella sp. ESL0232]|uniref:hypothetical protein n=1 Tax=Gilliamella sp. ESL0232 TaxID=2705037 RepID=UPI0015812FA0|nr:hypothetical protein [Gilliamella sp. ESL0232]NUE96564.1 hypothetical protein [Gilliamella sp. ESL0232]